MPEALTVSRRAQVITLLGCGLFLLSIVLPVMRWQASAHHTSSGSARVFLGDGFTLVDGGFGGSDLVVASALAVLVVAMAALGAGIVGWLWSVQVAGLAVLAYYPLWVLYVFAKKLEDEVFPAEGVVTLVAALAALVWGTWLGRPAGRRALSAG